MYKNHSLLKKFLLLNTLFTLHCTVTYANTLTTCPGRPASTLSWSTSNIVASGCSLVTGGATGACYFSPNADVPGSVSMPNGTTCNVTLTCGAASASADLTYDASKIWNGSACVVPPTGSLSVSPSSCTIATGASSCNTNFTWSTTNPIGTSAITTNYPVANTVAASANSGTAVAIAVAGPPGTKTFSLYNSGVLLDTKTVTTSCAGGWDTVSGTCRDPQVVSAGFVGQYYPLGTLSLTCGGSNSYSVELGGVSIIPITAYSSPVTLNNISTDGNYTIQCRYGSVSSQVARRYNATPPAAVVDLSISPSTLTKGDNVIVTWSTTFPTNACTLTARVVCANNSCAAAQTAAQTALNATLAATTTDPNDKYGSRSLQTAIKTVAPGHKDNDVPVIVTDWKALGKKTLRILYTTDLTYECSPTSKETKRIKVTKSVDQ